MYKVVSLFSGAGGSDLGFKQAGFDIIWANDFFKDAVETYKKNIGNHIVYGDITEIDSSEIPDNPDVVIGTFPCQGFSVANTKRSMCDTRNFLYKELLRVVRDKRPKYFVAENVKGLLSIEKGKVIEMIVKDFEALGYKVDYRVLNSAEYGVPQMRERVIIIGNRVNLPNPFPIKTHYIDRPVANLLKCPTVSETISDLSTLSLSESPILSNSSTPIYNHIASTNVKDKFWGRAYEVDITSLREYLISAKKQKGYNNQKIAELMNDRFSKIEHYFRGSNTWFSVPDKEDYLKLKEILDLDDRYDKELLTYIEKDIKFEQSLRITNWDRPSDTITATTPEIHINKERRLSVREVARLQTFPDDFVFTGALRSMYTQVGNAVPVELSRLIALGIKEQLSTL